MAQLASWVEKIIYKNRSTVEKSIDSWENRLKKKSKQGKSSELE